MNIRPALPSDCLRLLELIHELAEYEKAPEEVIVSLSHFLNSGFGVNPVWWAFVAEDEATQQVVGFALYYIRYSTWRGQQMYLEDIIVTNAYRGKGIGGLLMDVLIEEAKQKKFSGICWQVLNWNEPAINFYKKYNATFDEGWMNVMLKH